MYHEKYLAERETIEIAGHSVERRHYFFPVEEGVRAVERRAVLFLGNNWAVRLQGADWGEPELSFSTGDSHVHIFHDFEKGFSAQSSSSHDLTRLAKDIQDAQTVLEWAEALYADWQSYFAYALEKDARSAVADIPAVANLS